VEQVTELSYALDTFYFLVCGALVMWMAAGFTMLEAGLVRAKNTAEILTKNVGLYAIACIMYMLVGYNLMYPGDDALIAGILGKFAILGKADNTAADVIASGGDTYYSTLSDFFFQVVFVATTMSIVSGAVAERMKLWSFFTFAVILTGFIYPMQGYWKWGGGFLNEAGFSDFAGSGVVHMCGAAAALAGVLVLGARKGKYGKDGSVKAIPGANMPLATLGMLILWMGWFGFNGGSELKVSNVGEANSVALVFVNTNMAAAGGIGPGAGLVPFHKLSQWLSYSLFEPLEQAGVVIDEPDALTGLPEYRNGGLFLDTGVLCPKHPGVTEKAHSPDSQVIVEWRALTVALLDRIADPVRAALGRRDLALANILEGGTWSAGRKIARERRHDGRPPITIVSDGTVF